MINVSKDLNDIQKMWSSFLLFFYGRRAKKWPPNQTHYILRLLQKFCWQEGEKGGDLIQD
jgi:hypothetical protein